MRAGALATRTVLHLRPTRCALERRLKITAILRAEVSIGTRTRRAATRAILHFRATGRTLRRWREIRSAWRTKSLLTLCAESGAALRTKARSTWPALLSLRPVELRCARRTEVFVHSRAGTFTTRILRARILFTAGFGAAISTLHPRTPLIAACVALRTSTLRAKIFVSLRTTVLTARFGAAIFTLDWRTAFAAELLRQSLRLRALGWRPLARGAGAFAITLFTRLVGA
ncbi:MAG TPA: hypothetical protein VI454_12230 [Verrucomicrobiae bacterium]